MIEINLVPDVKQELIKAKRVQALVISGAILVGIVAIGIVVLLALYLFGVQAIQSHLADDAITSKSKQLANVPGLSDMLTIQNQLTKVTDLQNEKNIDSRFFDLLNAINPSAPNAVRFSVASIDSGTKTINLEGQAANGYVAADILKKTILGTTISYKDSSGTKQTASLTTDVEASQLSYGEDATGAKVLLFTMTFTYNDAFFARSSQDAIIVPPAFQNATDSYKGVPQSLFVDRPNSVGGTN
jgi:hypothetical protein